MNKKKALKIFCVPESTDFSVVCYMALCKFLFPLLFTLSYCGIGYASSLEISKVEQAWLDENPDIRIGIANNLPPHSMVNKSGTLEGIDAEVLTLLNEQLSGHLTIVTGNWQKIYNDAKEGKLDGLMNFTPSETRRKYFNFTRPYMSVPHVIVAPKIGAHFSDFSSLIGHTVALERGAYLVSYIEEHYPRVKINEYKNTRVALEAVQRGESQAFIGSKILIEFALSNYDMDNLDIHGESDQTSETNVIAIRKSIPELASLLDRALASISKQSLQAVTGDWGEQYYNITGTPNVKLTNEEIIWTTSHPEIVVGAETDWPPYDYVANGNAAGFSNDYIRLLAQKVGLKLRFVHGYTWPELLEMGRRKEVDLFPCLSKSEKRKEYLNFTRHYLLNTESLIVHKDTKEIESLDDMAGKILSRIKGYSSNQVVREKYPEIKFLYVDTPTEALIAVSEGRADAFMDYLAVANYLRREHLIADLRVAKPNALSKTFPLYIGARKDWPMLITILEKAMSAVTQEEFANLKDLWFATEEMDTKKLNLTPAEQVRLKNIGTIRVGLVRNWPPIQYDDKDGSHLGLTSEYLKILQRDLGLEFAIVKGSWAEIIQQTKEGNIDLLPFVNKSAEREKFLTFSNPLVRIPFIIGTRTDAPYYPYLNNLNGVEVGMGKGYFIQEKLENDYPEIKVRGFDGVKEALLALKDGEVGAVVLNSAVFAYYQNELGLKSSIHINNTTPYYNVLSVGVRPEFKNLVPLINRVIAGVSSQEHDLIINKWSNLPIPDPIIDWRLVWYWVVIISSVTGLFFIMTLFWNWRLKKEIIVQKQIKKELALAKKTAEAANQAKSIFLTSMSHELRTPMNAILGFTQLMQRSATLSDTERKNLQIINSSGEHLQELINEVLELSKIEAGAVSLNKATFNLHEQLETVIQMFQSNARAKGVAINMARSPKVPRLVVGDELKLRQILINLLGNALKFTEKGSVRLHIAAPVIAQQQRLVIEVKDTGIGIAENKLKVIFKPFEQITLSNRTTGSGLGLVISRNYARLMDGDITVQSNLGEGSLFRLEIGIEKGNAVGLRHNIPTEKVKCLAPGQSELRVLVVDDSSTNRELLHQTLEAAGFIVQDAQDGEIAVDIFEQWSPHLILMDCQMPVMDGLMATRKIKKTAAGMQTVVIAISASAFAEDRKMAIEAGCDDFLSKPINIDKLFEMIGRQLKVRYVFDEEANSSFKPTDVLSDCAVILRQRLNKIPKPLQRDLRNVILFHDIKGINDLIEKIMEIDVQIGSALQTLVDDFAYSVIKESLDDHLEENRG